MNLVLKIQLLKMGENPKMFGGQLVIIKAY